MSLHTLPTVHTIVCQASSVAKSYKVCTYVVIVEWMLCVYFSLYLSTYCLSPASL